MIRPSLLLPLASAVLACAALTTGCAADPTRQGDTVADASSTTLGSYIPRKKSAGAGTGNVGTANMQSLENDRINGNGVINLPQK
jgi:opacity protein-like surface antigen